MTREKDAPKRQIKAEQHQPQQLSSLSHLQHRHQPRLFLQVAHASQAGRHLVANRLQRPGADLRAAAGDAVAVQVAFQLLLLLRRRRWTSGGGSAGRRLLGARRIRSSAVVALVAAAAAAAAAAGDAGLGGNVRAVGDGSGSQALRGRRPDGDAVGRVLGSDAGVCWHGKYRLN